MYGIYNTKKKEFQFGICEPGKRKARQKLFEKIGKDAYKWNFIVKQIKEEQITKMRLKRQLRH